MRNCQRARSTPAVEQPKAAKFLFASSGSLTHLTPSLADFSWFRLTLSVCVAGNEGAIIGKKGLTADSSSLVNFQLVLPFPTLNDEAICTDPDFPNSWIFSIASQVLAKPHSSNHGWYDDIFYLLQALTLTLGFRSVKASTLLFLQMDRKMYAPLITFIGFLFSSRPSNSANGPFFERSFGLCFSDSGSLKKLEMSPLRP